MTGLLLAMCLSADPATLTLYEFERKLDLAVPDLRFARYVTTPDRSRAVAVLWIGKNEDQLGNPKLVSFRPGHRVREIVLDADGDKFVRAIKPPPRPDVLLDEPPGSECGAWLADLLKGLESMSEKGELRVIGAKWEVLATKHEGGGHFRNRKMDKPVEYRVEPGYFEAFVETAKSRTLPALTAPEEVRACAFGRRGLAVQVSEKKILLSLKNPWDKLAVGTVRMDGYREVALEDWFAKKVDYTPDFSELVITVPKPKLDPLVPLLKP